MKTRASGATRPANCPPIRHRLNDFCFVLALITIICQNCYNLSELLQFLMSKRSKSKNIMSFQTDTNLVLQASSFTTEKHANKEERRQKTLPT